MIMIKVKKQYQVLIKGFWVCYGNYGHIYSMLEKDPIVRINAFLNHLINLLNG